MMSAILLTAAHDQTTRDKLAAIIASSLMAPAEDHLGPVIQHYLDGDLTHANSSSWRTPASDG